MRIVLSLLLSFVLLQAQCFALSGGPVYPGGTGPITGTYAGVLLPDGDEDNNAIGLFTLGIPETGLSSGDFLFFSQGRIFEGTINGFADPDNLSVRGLFQGSYEFSLTTTFVNPITGDITINSEDFTSSATGKFDAQVIPNPTATFTGVIRRLTGTAHLDVNQGLIDPVTFEPIIAESLDLIIDGIQQSTEPPAAAAATTTTGG